MFGSKNRSNDRTETLVMITPTVIQSNADLKQLSDDIKREFKEIPSIKFHTLQKPENE